MMRMSLQLSSKVSSSSSFYSRYYSLSHVSLSEIVLTFIVLSSAEFSSLRDKVISIRLERKYCTVKESTEANFIFTSIEVYVH